MDVYGMSDPSAEVPGARVWDCQAPATEDAGRWAVVSANALRESHECEWLVPHLGTAIAGGSMYALQLPSPIPAAGSAGGPPLPANRKKLFGLPFDLRAMLIEVTRDPSKLPAAYAELERLLAPERD